MHRHYEAMVRAYTDIGQNTSCTTNDFINVVLPCCMQLHQTQTPILAARKWSHAPWKPSTHVTSRPALFLERLIASFVALIRPSRNGLPLLQFAISEYIKAKASKFNTTLSSLEYNLILNGNSVVVLSCLRGEHCLQLTSRGLPTLQTWHITKQC